MLSRATATKMSSSDNRSSVAGHASFPNDQLTDGDLFAICGLGVRASGDVRGAEALWNKLTAHFHGAGSGSGEKDIGHELNDEDRRAISDETGQLAQVQQTLLEVAYEAIQDGAQVNYRGQKARVGCFVTTFGEECTQRDENDQGYSTEETGDATLASQVSETYDLAGPR